MIPKEITRDHIIQAIQKIKNEEIPEKRESIKFDLVFKDEKFPHKLVLSIAGRYTIGQELSTKFFPRLS